MDIRRQVGMNVARIRREQGLSQEELAFRSGLHRTYISGVERGIRNPTITVIQEIASALVVDVAILVASTKQNSKYSGIRY
ncbi:helix-turn-helix transcriptional regulator [Kordiimonas marina]|uniref:helix-turn-helix domain-containing protein n=1 Tax=Kordiimonas marina TaxID=2872312 RepID=UPI0031BB0D76|nr:helix-turn-helix domain-containing protein [Kordiimonas marina]